MTLKTYRARTMSDALAEVKRDLGRDAVILHTRSYKVGGLLGVGAKPIVEITASDGQGVRRAPAPVMPPASRLSMSSGSAHSATAEPPVAPPPIPNAAQAVAAYASGVPRQAIGQAVAFQERETPVTRAPAVPQPAAVMDGLDGELAAIKRMVGQVLQCTTRTALHLPHTAGTAPVGMPDALSQHYLKLLEQEVAADIADDLIARVRHELNMAELEDAAIVRQTLARHVAELIPADADTPRPARGPDGRPFTIALVGPTGVGKTTTIAKLAAAYKLRHGRKVGLVTTDTYRIAAVDQLRTYAEIIGLPLKVAMSASDIAGICESLADCDAILIDTAGRSQRDDGRLEELRQFIAAARPHQTHLVLSSTAGQAVLLEAAQRFAQVNPDRLLFTKLDEAVNFGVLLSVVRKVSLKLSYITTGQEVPDHIEIGRPDRIARLLLDGAAPR